MILEFIKFEWKYRLKRPATWIYAAFVLLFSTFLIKYFFSSSFEMQSNSDLFTIIIVCSFLFLPIISAIMGVPNIRDRDYNLTSILLSKPIKKYDLFLGRFLGSLIIVLLIFITFVLGTFFSYIINNNALPASFWVQSLVTGFLVYMIPNVLFFSVLFYGIASLIKKRGIIYSQGFIALIIIQFLFVYSRNVPSKSMIRFFEPLGIYALRFDNIYISTLNRRTWLPNLHDDTFLNRLFVICISIVCFYLFYRLFRFDLEQSNSPAKKNQLRDIIPMSNKPFHSYQNEFLFSSVLVFFKSSSFYFNIIFREVFFRIVSILGFVFICYLLFNKFTASDRMPFATTANIIPSISGGLMTILSVLTIYYAGDLIFKEKNIGFNPILDISPIQKWLILGSKVIGFMGANLVLTAIMLSFGLVFQLFNGNTDIKWSIYFWEVFIQCVLENFIWVCLFIFVQTLVASRSLGPIVCVIIYFALGIGVNFGFENPLYSYNSLSINSYNDWNGYGQYLEHYAWTKLFWLALAFTLFTISIPLQFNDTSNNRWERFRNFNKGLTFSMKATIMISLAIFAMIGYFIYFTVEFKGEGFQSFESKRKLMADYERNFEKFKSMPQPKITQVSLELNLPNNRKLTGNATYTLKNKTKAAIKKLYIQEPFGDKAYFIKNLKTNLPFLDSIDARFGFHVLTLANALKPNDSLILMHEIAYIPQHFSYMSGINYANIVENGSTFTSNQNLISLGFNASFIIDNESDRQSENLPKFLIEEPINDSYFGKINATNGNADAINLDLKITTEGNQRVVGLENYASDGSKNKFKLTSKNIPYDFAFVIGDFKTTTENINGTQIEYNIHPKHLEQLVIIKKATRDALLFMNERIGAYPYKTLTIAEAAPFKNDEFQVYPNLILLRESMMVSSGIDADLKFDRTYETIVTAITKQWFGKKVNASKVKGNQILQVSINRYLTSLILNKNQSEAAKNDYLKQEYQNYRSAIRKLTESEASIDAIKDPTTIESRGVIILNSLAATIGQVQVIDAIKKLYEAFAVSEKYPNYGDLMQLLNQQVGADKKHYISEAFEKQMIFDHRLIDEVKTIKNKDNYTFIINFEARKYEIDSKNKEKTVLHEEPLEVGFLDENDKILKIIEIKQIQAKNKAYISFDKKPFKIIIDPRYNYFDLVRQDNVLKL